MEKRRPDAIVVHPSPVVVGMMNTICCNCLAPELTTPYARITRLPGQWKKSTTIADKICNLPTAMLKLMPTEGLPPAPPASCWSSLPAQRRPPPSPHTPPSPEPVHSAATPHPEDFLLAAAGKKARGPPPVRDQATVASSSTVSLLLPPLCHLLQQLQIHPGIMSSEELTTRMLDLAVASQAPMASQISSSGDLSSEGGAQVTCFSEDLHDVTLHFQIIRMSKQIYAWIGCNQSAKFGHLYAAATTRLGDGVSVTSVLGGTSDNTGSSMARRLVLKTGLNIILACNIPKDSPMLEAAAERKLVEKLRSLGYIRSKPVEANASTTC
ncbi:hypothetical protein ZWY2020_036614 [Hordeum vulgare]|nr:hypothetical protein ZWY2020_036614 [Hordeum vulgare]